jgi:predicted ATPase/DNA-binding SARP family transcriptional activator/uncharacterized protein HemY
MVVWVLRPAGAAPTGTGGAQAEEMQDRIELLAGLRVVQRERVINRFPTRQTGALLAYLACYCRQSHPREILMELLWPDVDPAAGRHNLRQALSFLRRLLEAPGREPGVVLVADRAVVRLNAAAVSTDVAEFEAALQSAACARSALERAQRLTDAAALYRGELLPGYYDDWVFQERSRLAEAHFQALQQLVRYHEGGGDLPRALDYARRAVTADPLREEAQREAIRLLAATGQREAALRQYRELERILDEELGGTPDTATLDLVRTVAVGAVSRSHGTDRAGQGVGSKRTGSVDAPAWPSPGPTLPPSALPTGTVVFLLVAMGELPPLPADAPPDQIMPAEVWERCQELLRPLLRRQGGHELPVGGETLRMAFGRASDALAAALAGQRTLAADPWPTGTAPGSASGTRRARMALHVGEVAPGDELHRSQALEHATRLLLAAHPGQILLSEGTAALLNGTMDEKASLTDLGLYRLSDHASPERLLQVCYPEMGPQPFPAPNALPGFEGHLPPTLTRFFGREEEITHLLGLLAETRRGPSRAEATRLVTLTGPGGIGKTRLGLEVASRARVSFRGSVWFVPLADLADASMLIERIHHSLSLPPNAGIEPVDQVAAMLSRQRALLVLDNFEHLLVEGVPAVRRLLERVPTLICLVTSRQRLDMIGEKEFPVQSLPTPLEEDTPEQLLRCVSVQLFVDRAQAVRPDFQVTEAQRASVATLCRRLEGIPLALELAAARAWVLTPAQMLGRLEQRFELLVSRQHGLAPRHRSLRAVLDWSYELLSAELQRFLAWLSVFRGGWTLAAAEAVCNAPLALDHLEQLRACSLVVAKEQGGEVRYRLLETIRQYAEEKLRGSHEEVGLRRSHRDWFLRLAEEAESQMATPERWIWLERLETEHDNFRTALDGSEKRREVAEGFQLAIALMPLWTLPANWSEGRKHLERLLSFAEPVDRTERAKVLHAVGKLAVQQGDQRAARAYLEQSLAIYREADDRVRRADILALLGRVALDLQGDVQTARGHFEECLAVQREAGDDPAASSTLFLLGAVAAVEGKYGLVQELWQASLVLSRTREQKQWTSRMLTRLGRLAYEQGECGAAVKLLEEATAIVRELACERKIALPPVHVDLAAGVRCDGADVRTHFEEWLKVKRILDPRSSLQGPLLNVGQIVYEQGDYMTACSLWEEALAIQTETGDRQGLALTLNLLGRLAHCRGNDQAAETLLKDSLRLAQELDFRCGIADALHGRGVVACEKGDPEEGRRLLEESLALTLELGRQWPITLILNDLGVLARRQGQWDVARALLEESVSRQRVMGRKHGIATSLISLGDLTLVEGDTVGAWALFNEGLILLKPLFIRAGIVECLEGCAAVAGADGNPEWSIRLFGAAAALREAIGYPQSWVQRREHAARQAASRTAIGKAAFQTAWEAGYGLSWEEAVAEVVREETCTRR